MPGPEKINWQFQDLHSATPSRDWTEIQKLEADICLFYQQQAHYSYVMSDLYYGDVYSLPYWAMLNLTGLDEDQSDFIQSGCLMILLAMCWELLDGSGSFLTPHIAVVLEGVRSCQPASARVALLRNHVEDVLLYVAERYLRFSPAAKEEKNWTDLVNTSGWAHKEFVIGYFRQWCKQFDESPYYSSGGKIS